MRQGKDSHSENASHEEGSFTSASSKGGASRSGRASVEQSAGLHDEWDGAEATRGSIHLCK